MNVRVLPAAQEDARAIRDRLDIQPYGVGSKFAADMRQAITAIGANPQMYSRTDNGPDEPENREYYIARFEYRVIYAIWKGEAVIVAVIHARNRPRSWQGRLTELD